MKETLRNIIGKTLIASGFTRLSRRMIPKDGAVILYGHRLSADNEGYLQGLDPRFFDQQLTYLTSSYSIISLSELLGYYHRKATIPRNAIVVTFDDGFRDNFIHGLPLLRKHGVSACVFVTTDSIQTGRLPWSQRLGYMFQKTTCDSILHPLSGPKPFPLKQVADRKRAYQNVKRTIRRMVFDQREESLEQISALLDVVPPSDRMLTWDHCRELMRAGIEIGAHTVSHALLDEIPLEAARAEIQGSMDAIRDNLGLEHPPFCFPAGSFSDELVGMVREIGFSSVFKPVHTVRVNNLTNSDPFSLQRIGLPNGPAHQLEAELDGIFHLIRKVYR